MTRSPRVLFTAPDLEKMGGVAAYCRTLLPYFTVEPRVLRRGSPRGERGPAAVLRLTWDTVAGVRAVLFGGVDLVHQNTSFGRKGMVRDAPLARAAKASGRKLLVFLHGWDSAFEPAFTSRGSRWLRRAYFRADAIAVLAQEFGDRLRDWGYTGRILVETTVVDDALLRDAPARSSGAGPTLLFLARVAEDKGVFEAIEAFRALRARHPALRLVVAGDGLALPGARAAAEGLDDVHFTGYVRGAEKAAAFASADVYLLPTRHGEGLPTSVLEAMAFGIPVVAPPVAGLADHLVDGRTGFVAGRTDAATFSALCERLLEDPQLRARIGAFNAAYAHDRFLASAVARRLERVYQELAG